MCQCIDLFPAVKPEKKKFHTVKICINKAKKQIVQLKMMMKDGGTQQYDIKSMKPNTEMADALFVFDLKGFKSFEIIKKLWNMIKSCIFLGADICNKDFY